MLRFFALDKFQFSAGPLEFSRGFVKNIFKDFIFEQRKIHDWNFTTLGTLPLLTKYLFHSIFIPWNMRMKTCAVSTYEHNIFIAESACKTRGVVHGIRRRRLRLLLFRNKFMSEFSSIFILT